jgi:signal-transduction protein with cAMP-binding, CBS, and nucleotidyltransferase domain
VEQYQIKSNWKIENGYSLVEVVESSNPKVVAVGKKITDRVISVDEKEFVYEAADGRKQTLTRIKE